MVLWINMAVSIQNPKPGDVYAFSLSPKWSEPVIAPWSICSTKCSVLLVEPCQCQVHVALTQTHALQQDFITLKVIFRQRLADTCLSICSKCRWRSGRLFTPQNKQGRSNFQNTNWQHLCVRLGEEGGWPWCCLCSNVCDIHVPFPLRKRKSSPKL